MSKEQSRATSLTTAGVVRQGRYFDEFKQDAIRLVNDGEYSFTAAAAAVGVGKQTLRQWTGLPAVRLGMGCG